MLYVSKMLRKSWMTKVKIQPLASLRFACRMLVGGTHSQATAKLVKRNDQIFSVQIVEEENPSFSTTTELWLKPEGCSARQADHNTRTSINLQYWRAKPVANAVSIYPSISVFPKGSERWDPLWVEAWTPRRKQCKGAARPISPTIKFRSNSLCW